MEGTAAVEYGYWNDPTRLWMTPDPTARHPEMVRATPWLALDIQSLLHLLQDEKLPVRMIRTTHITYGFGDASGMGFEERGFSMVSREETGFIRAPILGS